MAVAARARTIRAPAFLDPPGYVRHRPEATLLYQLVEKHCPAFRALRAAADRPLPEYVQQELDAYLMALNWARRLKRVFGIEIERCARCGGKLAILASIEEPQLIAKILSHLKRTAPQQYPIELPLGARAPPVQSRLL